MDAALIFKEKFDVRLKSGKVIVVFMDLYRLPKGHDASYPEGYKFSWIAFNPDDETAKVLFDCHSPKGPHIHIDQDPEGVPFQWTSLDDATDFFFSKVQERFGEFAKEESEL